MPPSRRFSAAPFLNCPHRATSAAQSLMSLTSQTFSIDSSESMITVIHVNRGPDKRPSNGSLIYSESNLNGSYTMIPRSPVSPRSPSRCSPGLVVSNPSEISNVTSEQTGQSQQGYPVLNSPTSSSINFHSISQGNHPGVAVSRPNSFNSFQVQTGTEHIKTSDNLNDNDFDTTGSNKISIPILSPTTSNLIAEDHKRVQTSTGLNDNDQLMVFGECLNRKSSESDLRHRGSQHGSGTTSVLEQQHKEYNDNSLDTSAFERPEFHSSVNDFCVRHSREELEFLVGQIGHLRISDCYFSERRTTLCTVIEVREAR